MARAWHRLHERLQHAFRPIAEHKALLRDEAQAVGANSILDYGCGTGIFSDCFAPESYLGYDPDALALDLASRRHPRHRFVSRRPEDAASRPLAFDLVVLNLVLHHIPSHDRQDVIADCVRLLAPRGTLVIIEVSPPREQSSPVLKSLMALEMALRSSRFLSCGELESLLPRGVRVDNEGLGRFYAVRVRRP